MPELPEVETVVRGLRGAIVGHEISHVEVVVGKTMAGSPEGEGCLVGRRIEGVERKGKYIIVVLRGGYGMVVHLRMTGWLGLERHLKDVAANEKYVRVWFGLKGKRGKKDRLVFDDIRRFGRVWCGKMEDLMEMKSLKKLGEDALRVGVEEFYAGMRERRGRMKSLMLNQSFVAGVGNIYADESLFGAGIHPLAVPGRVSKKRVVRLWESMREVLEDAVEHGGTTIKDYRQSDGGTGEFEKRLRVYGRAGEACERCGGVIQRIVVGQRGTWFCKGCQKR